MKILVLSLLICFALSYNPSKAISYARQYCKNYNSKYKNYAPYGGDCANFVSQCLIAGGQKLSGCSGTDGYGTIPLVSNLRSCLSAKGWKYSQGVSKKFKAGYPFFSGNSHAMISTSVSGSSLKYCGHTNDRCDHPMTAPSGYLYVVD